VPRTVREQLFDFGQQLGTVFSTQPTAGENKKLWFPRDELERDMSYVLGNATQHICVDGPSGTGKTSLAQHVMVKNRSPFMLVQVYKGMTWSEFCRRFVEILRQSKTMTSGGIKGVFNLFKIGIDAELKYSEEYSEKDSYDLLLSMSSSWTPDDVGR
jgi:AAA domain-containing protein